MSLKRAREYPTKQQSESADDFVKRLRDAAQEEATDRIQDFDILQLANVPWVDAREYGVKGDGVIDDTIAIQAANDAAAGKTVFLPAGSYAVSSLTIDNCTLTGAGQEVTTLIVTGTITVQETTSWGICGRLHNMKISTAASYASTVVKLTGFLNRQTLLLDKIRIYSDSKTDITASSIGLLLDAQATDAAHLKAIASSTFGPIIVEGYEYGVKFDANETAGMAYINANLFQSLKIFNSKYLIRIEKAGTSSLNNNIFPDLFLQGYSGNTVDGLQMVGIQKHQINFSTDGTFSGDEINLDSNTWLNILTGTVGGGNFVDAGDRNIFINLEGGTKQLSLVNNPYGHQFTDFRVNQTSTERYLLLAQKIETHAIVGTFTGRKSAASSAGENSARVYINVLSDNVPNTYSYWEIDSQAVAVNIVELTYDGNVWIALDAIDSEAIRPLQYTLFTGQYTEQTDQLTWVAAGSVSGVTAVSSTRTINTGRELNGSDTWDPGSIADGNEEAKDVTATGAALGDFALASFSVDVADLVLNAQVTVANTVTCVLANNTGDAVDLASGTIYVRVIKK